MEPPRPEPPPATLRPLHAAADSIEALRAGGLDADGRRRAILRATHAVEGVLRRLLRDAVDVPLELRLRALAPDELRPDEVLAELRRHDQLSIGAAAAVHELLEARRRLVHGSAPDDADTELTLRVVRQVEREALQPPAAAAPALAAAPEETEIHEVPAAGRPDRARFAAWAAVVILLLVIGAGLVWRAAGREEAGLAQGITLFRSGAYADAAAHFWRYAEANPDDATPHLYLARIHRRMGRPDLAAPEVRTALRLAPDDADAHAELGFLLLETQQPEVAVERFRTAIRHDAEAAEAWIGLVRALRASGRAEAAEAVLARAPERVRAGFSRSPAPGL